MKPTIAISMDMDWAPDAVIADSLDLLAKFNLRATLFMTHRTPLVEKTAHELGIHPHFKTLDLEKHLRERLEEYPQSKGTRSHTLFDTYQLQPLYERLGLEYQSNVLMYQQPNIQSYRISQRITELPIYFMDNISVLIDGNPPLFQQIVEKLNRPGLKIFDFHPIHIFLNMDCLERYEKAKVHYHDAKELLGYRNTKKYGTRDLFIEFLTHLKACQIQTHTLGELAQDGLKRKLCEY